MPSILLPPVLDVAAAVPLQALLLSHKGQDLDLDGSAVVRMGGQCLQLLIATKRTWAAEGRSVRLMSPSDACKDALDITHASTLLLGGEE